MARSSDQLFATFAARVAELLRERLGMDPVPLLHVRPRELIIEGRLRETQEGGAEWLPFRASPERLEWDGPERLAQGFVTEYEMRRRAIR